MMASTFRPPLFGRALLRIARLRDRREEREADLLELFLDRAETRGLRHARWRYVVDAASVCMRGLLPSPTTIGPLSAARFAGNLLTDARFALRLFRRQPGIITMAILGLGLAIGLNTAAFSIVSAINFRPLGVSQPDQTVLVAQRIRPGSGLAVRLSWPYEDYVRLHERAKLMRVEAWVRDGVTFTSADGEPLGATVPAGFVSGGFFQTLGGHAAIGRPIEPADDAPGVAPVVVLSDSLWRSQFGGDPAVVGATTFIAGTRVTIIGVAERSFRGPAAEPPAAWLALGSAPAVYDYLGPFGPASGALVEIVGVLDGRGTAPAAQAEATALVSAWGDGSGSGARPGTARSAELQPAARRWSSERLLQVALDMATFGLILLLACTNVANLLLSGATTRAREIAARLALGASRGRIIRQLLTESLLLGVIGGGLGLVLAVWMLPGFVRLVGLPAGIDPAPDWRVFAFTASAAIVTGVLSGLAAARHGARGDLLAPLKGVLGHAGAQTRPSRLRSIFLAVQAAASALLLVLAALFGRAVLHASHRDYGFDPARFAAVALGFPGDRQGTRIAPIYPWALDRARAVPGVQDAAIVLMPPLGNSWMPITIGPDAGVPATENRTSAEYFRTTGLTLVRGRTYTADEVRTEAPVAVISAQIARELFPANDAIGRLLDTSGRRAWPGMPDLGKIRVIGIVADVVARLMNPDVGSVYLPLTISDLHGSAQLWIRTAGDASTLARPVKDAIRGLDPQLRVAVDVTSEALRRELDPGRSAATLVVLLGTAALGLAVLGIFGVTSFVVGQRLTEVGVRMALGAPADRIARLLLFDSLGPVALGLGAGVMLALVVGQWLASALYGLSPRDPLAIATAMAVLSAAAAGAALLPIARAMRVDPARILRES